MAVTDQVESMESLFLTLQEKYDSEIVLLHAKNETAGSLKAYIELEQYKLQRSSKSDLDINMGKIKKLKDRFVQLHRELKYDAKSAKELLRYLKEGKQELCMPTCSHEEHMVQKVNIFIEDVRVLCHEMDERLYAIHKSLLTFKSLIESKRRLLHYLGASLAYLKSLQIPIFDSNS